MLLGSVLAGKLSDIRAEKAPAGSARVAMILPGCAFILIGSAMLCAADMTRMPAFSAAAFILSFASCWGIGAVYPAIPELFSRERVPVSTGLIGGVGDMGMPLAPMIVGVVFGARNAWAIGWATCAMFAVVSFLSLLTILLLRKRAA
jgi:nitrate/nitrite transporter NarK